MSCLLSKCYRIDIGEKTYKNVDLYCESNHLFRDISIQEESDVTIRMSELEVEEKLDASIRSPKQVQNVQTLLSLSSKCHSVNVF